MGTERESGLAVTVPFGGGGKDPGLLFLVCVCGGSGGCLLVHTHTHTFI